MTCGCEKPTDDGDEDDENSRGDTHIDDGCYRFVFLNVCSGGGNKVRRREL